MLIAGEGGLMSGDIAAKLAQMEALAADLRRLLDDATAPTPEQLAAAPLLEAWAVGTRPIMCLVGTMTRHQEACPRRHITLGMLAFAPTLGWARTLGSLYRLGAPRALSMGGPVELPSPAASAK